MTEEEKDELLVELKTDIKWIKEGFKTHLSQHWQLKLMAAGAILSAILALVL